MGLCIHGYWMATDNIQDRSYRLVQVLAHAMAWISLLGKLLFSHICHQLYSNGHVRPMIFYWLCSLFNLLLLKLYKDSLKLVAFFVCLFLTWNCADEYFYYGPSYSTSYTFQTSQTLECYTSSIRWNSSLQLSTLVMLNFTNSSFFYFHSICFSSSYYFVCVRIMRPLQITHIFILQDWIVVPWH